MRPDPFCTDRKAFAFFEDREGNKCVPMRPDYLDTGKITNTIATEIKSENGMEVVGIDLEYLGGKDKCYMNPEKFYSMHVKIFCT